MPRHLIPSRSRLQSPSAMQKPAAPPANVIASAGRDGSTFKISPSLQSTGQGVQKSPAIRRSSSGTTLIQTNPGVHSAMGYIANGPYYTGPSDILPPRPPQGWLMGDAQPKPAKHTLVLDLDETLVHSSFQPVSGADLVLPVELEGSIYSVYVRKRPGVDAFLKEMAKHFEIVIFTASLAAYADAVLDRLDPNGVSKIRLYRDSCTFCGGLFVKDLSRLGRPLDNIVIIDNSPASYNFHTGNAIGISTWYDDPNDRELAKMTSKLIQLAQRPKVQQALVELF